MVGVSCSGFESANDSCSSRVRAARTSPTHTHAHTHTDLGVCCVGGLPCRYGPAPVCVVNLQPPPCACVLPVPTALSPAGPPRRPAAAEPDAGGAAGAAGAAGPGHEGAGRGSEVQRSSAVQYITSQRSAVQRSAKRQRGQGRRGWQGAHSGGVGGSGGGGGRMWVFVGRRHKGSRQALLAQGQGSGVSPPPPAPSSLATREAVVPNDHGLCTGVCISAMLRIGGAGGG